MKTTITLEPLPMEEAQAFWRGKVKLNTAAWSKLSAEAKIKAFAVSGLARGAELDTAFASLQRALDEGTTFADFKADMARSIERRGWTGKRAWRLDNIFRTNIQTAYNVGHYKQLREGADTLPYWMYSAINDRVTRPNHLAMSGRVWPADHPVWNTWYPPNGYRCRCSVIGLTKQQVRARKLKVEKQDPSNRLIEPIDPGSGNKMAARPLLPDPGFSHNPGKSYWGELGQLLADRLDDWPDQLSAVAHPSMMQEGAFAAWYEQPEGVFPVAILSKADADRIHAMSKTALLSKETALKQREHHPELAAEEYSFIQEAVTSGRIVQDGERTLVYILDRDSQGYVTVVKSTVTGKSVFVTSFRRLSRQEAKKDREIGRLLLQRKK